MRDEIPEEYREAQARIDQGLEPFGDISIEDRRRRYLDAISNDKADDERLVDPRVAAARIARANLAKDYEIEPERFELLQARARRKANQAFTEVPWDADLEAMGVDLVHQPEGDVEIERMLQIEEQFLADEVIADSPRRELKRLRDQLPYLGEFTDQVRELILASKADDTKDGTRIGTQFNLSRATRVVRDYLREFDPEHAEGLAAELIGYGLEVCIELEREEDVVYTQAHYAGRVWTRLERYRDREGLEPVVFQGERDQDAYELSLAASLFITFTSEKIPLWELELKDAKGDNKDLRTDIHLTEEGKQALKEFPTLLSLKTRPTKVPLFVRPRPLHDRTTGSWSNPYQPMPRKLFDEHETGDPERTELPPMYADALERFQGQAYRLNLGTRFAGSGWRLTDYRDEEKTNLFQLGSFFLECGAVWKKGDKGFVDSEGYAEEKEKRIQALRESHRYQNAPGEWPLKEWQKHLEKKINAETWWSDKRTAALDVIESLKLPILLGEAAQHATAEWFPRTYFPVFVDYRGRFYYRPLFSPQGDTFAKGVVEFYNQKPLNQAGINAMKRSLATLHSNNKDPQVKEVLGPSPAKKTKKEKEEWATKQWAKNHKAWDFMAWTPELSPPGHDAPTWSKTDSPFEFLAQAQAIGWTGQVDQEGGTFATGVPVRIDAVCSGVQHLATLARDEQIGHYVYLTSKRPNRDLYELLADEGEKILRRQGEQPLEAYIDQVKQGRKYLDAKARGRETQIENAKQAHQTRVDVLAYLDKHRKGKLERGECKAVGMQYGYNVGKSTIANRLRDDHDWPHEYAFNVALAQFAAIEAKGQGIARVMQWFHQVIGTLMDANLGFEWENQVTGFNLVQKYAATDPDRIDYAAVRGQLTDKGKQVQRTVHYRRISEGWLADLEANDPKRAEALRTKMINGIAANIVHSLDSALLVLIALEFPIEKDLTIIHDSVGTHANDVDELYQVIQHAHVELYSQDHLQDIYDQSKSRLEDAGADSSLLAPVPTRGSLVLEDVLKSEGFWS